MLYPKVTNFPNISFPIYVMPYYLQVPVGEHRHEFTEIVIVNEGSGVHYNLEETCKIEKGDVFVISGVTSHGYKDLQGLTITNILFDESKIDFNEWDLKKLSGYHALFKLEPKLRGSHSIVSNLRLSHSELITIQSMSDQLHLELKNRIDGYQFFAYAQLMQIIGYLSRCYSHTKYENNYSLLKVAKVLSYMETNYHKKITQDELAKIGRMSKSSLQRVFLKTFQQGAIEYLVQLRLTKAKELIKYTDQNFTQIALSTGFVDSNYFSRKFKEAFGLSPSDFKKANLSKLN
jgi:AraC-like DNA-binding protein